MLTTGKNHVVKLDMKDYFCLFVQILLSIRNTLDENLLLFSRVSFFQDSKTM